MAASSISPPSASWPCSILAQARSMNANGTKAGCPVALATATTRSAWAACLTEAVEVELGAGQVDGGVEPQCQLVVRERIDERCGLAR